VYGENAVQNTLIDNTMSAIFIVGTWLKQGDALSRIIFNLALEKVVMEL